MQKYQNSATTLRGDAIRGASITVTTLAGDLATLYSDNGVTQQANPIVTGRDGEYSFYAVNGRYNLSISAPGFANDSVTDFSLADPLETVADAAAAGSAAAQAIKTQIDHRYRGALAADPATRTDGTANQPGDEYFSTVTSRKMVYRAGGWLDFELSASTSANASEASRQATLVQAGLAATAKTGAEAAQALAQAAALASAVSLAAKDTIALGRASVADNVAFWVKPNATDGLARYTNYLRTSSTTQAYIADLVLGTEFTQKTEQLLNIAPTGFAQAVVDKDGLAAGGWKDDGTFAAKAAEIETLIAGNLSANALGVTGGDALQAGAPTGFVSAPVDQYGLSPGGWKDDGTWAAHSIEAQYLNGLPTALLPNFKFKGNYVTDIIHLISYGQSLSLGNGGTFIQTDMVLFDSLMFSAGVRVQEGAGTVAANHAAFVPLVSVLNATTGNGETPVANAAATIKRLILAENGLAHTDHRYQILVSAPGVSNTAIDGLKKGSAGYANLIADVTYGYALAQAAGKSYSVPTIFWSQGEADYNLGTTYAVYLAAFLQLYADLNADLKAITGWLFDVRIVAFQCVAAGVSPATVGLAQVEASRLNANILIACPSYSLPHLSAGNAHLTGPGYGMLGTYYGVTHKRASIDEVPCKPLDCVSAMRQGKLITLQFAVPVRPLVLDNALQVAVTNGGFSLVDNVGTAIAITSVTVTGPATVQIVAATAPPASSEVRYAYLEGGNLRDSQGLTLSANLKVAAPSHNACLAFKKTLA
jgi:hypothetical protein